MKRGGSVSGAVSLVMIFCVLCLAVFATLTLATANREKILSDTAAQRAGDFYAADAEATRIVAALRRGEDPGAAVSYADTSAVSMQVDVAEFSVPMGEKQELQVRVALLPNGECEILRWATAYAGDWEMNDSIEIWDGDMAVD